MPTASERLAEFAVSLAYDRIPEDARWAAKRFLLDTLGCLVGGWGEPQSRIARELAIELGGPPESSILLTSSRVSALNAVLGNGVAIRALDLMDMYSALDHAHPCELTVTPALALGERVDAAGTLILTAIVLGYEVAMKMAEITGVTRLGWAGTASLGQFASPVVAGRLLGLTRAQMAHAIGISGAHNISLAETYMGRVSMLKDALNVFVAQSGVLAALLAQRGFTGPAEVFDGPRGLWRQLNSEASADTLVEGLGTPFRITRCGFKDANYAVMAWTHPAIEACFALRRAHALTADRVVAIRVRTFDRAVKMLTLGPIRADFTRLDAQFNAPYIFAAALHFGDLGPDRLASAADPIIQALGAKVTVESDPDLDRQFPAACPAIVEVRTVDGRTYTQEVKYRRGNPENPLTDAELEAKFRQLAEPHLGPSRASAVIQRVWSLEQVTHVRDLISLFQPR